MCYLHWRGWHKLGLARKTFLQVLDRPHESFDAVSELSESQIAVVAEHAAHLAGDVVVVHVRRVRAAGDLERDATRAQRAAPTLLFQQPVAGLDRQPVFGAQAVLGLIRRVVDLNAGSLLALVARPLLPQVLFALFRCTLRHAGPLLGCRLRKISRHLASYH